MGIFKFTWNLQNSWNLFGKNTQITEKIIMLVRAFQWKKSEIFPVAQMEVYVMYPFLFECSLFDIHKWMVITRPGAKIIPYSKSEVNIRPSVRTVKSKGFPT